MRRMAIFVEGLTELIFVRRLVEEIGGAKRIRFEVREGQGGGASGARRLRLLQGSSPDTDQEFYVLLVNSQADNRVRSDIQDQYASLVRAGHEYIVGLRDVHPVSRAGIPKLRQELGHAVRTKPVAVRIILAVMEVEAWFLAEDTHLGKIDPSLTSAAVRLAMGFDPATEDMSLRDQPAEDLKAIYGLAGRSYSKRRKQVEATVECLDYGRLYLELPSRYPALAELIDAIDEFLTVPA